MSKMSFIDKMNIFFEVSKSSYMFMIIILILLIIGFIFLTTNNKNKKRNKDIYITCSIFIIAFIVITYHSSLSKIFDYMMNNLFIAIYFPNLAIYLAAMIIMNVIVWISIFNFKTSEIIKRVNVIIYIIMNYLLALVLSVINSSKLDVFEQSSVYANKKATALIELSSLIFVLWIIFLILYKIILTYVRKDYVQPVKKVLVKKKVKKFPENYTPKELPELVYGTLPKKVEIIKEEKEVKTVEDPKTKSYEQLLTLDDYKLLLKLLKYQKEKERVQRIRKEELLQDQARLEELERLYRSVK